MSVTCHEVNAKKRPCGQFLGYVETSRPNTSPQYCRRCKVMDIYDVKADGVVVKTRLPANARIKVYDETIVLGERSDG